MVLSAPSCLVAFMIANAGADSISNQVRRRFKLKEVLSLIRGPSRLKLPEVSPNMMLPWCSLKFPSLVRMSTTLESLPP
ncbi:unknown [Bacteroides sp. CAG:189]|nr:unknown [Bacteroides sp. CAG:189]